LTKRKREIQTPSILIPSDTYEFLRKLHIYWMMYMK